MNEKLLRDLRDWYIAEFNRRTELANENIDWTIPAYRVSWTEVAAAAERLGIKMNPVDLRLWCDEHFK